MPTRAHMQIPLPRSWDEFEDIVCSALKVRWGTSALHRHGRSGQAQQGVDIFGDDDAGRAAGVQCKLVAHGEFGNAELEAAVLAAESFVPALDTFVIAATSPRDAAMQQAARLLSRSRADAGKFPVGLLFWDDIVADILKDERVARLHFPELFPGPAATAPPSWLRDRSVAARIRRYVLGSLQRVDSAAPGAAGEWLDARVWGHQAPGYAFGWAEIVHETNWLRQRGLVTCTVYGNGVLRGELTADGRDLVGEHGIEPEKGDTVVVGKSYILALRRSNGEQLTTGGKITAIDRLERKFRPPGGVERGFAFDEVVVAEEYDPNHGTPALRMAELHRAGFTLADYCFASWLGQFEALGLPSPPRK